MKIFLMVLCISVAYVSAGRFYDKHFKYSRLEEEESANSKFGC